MMSVTRRLVTEISQHLRSLGAAPSPQRVEEIAFAVLRAYTSPSRYFHDLDHIFFVASSHRPLEYLAGIFHDIVYFQVDDGVTTDASRFLSATVERVDGGAVVRPANGDRFTEACFCLFGKKAGEPISVFAGLNELLSALVAGGMLRGILSDKQCLQIATMIEATIPFRPQSEENDWTLGLEQKFAAAAKILGVSYTEDDVRSTITSAIEVANRDVGSFGEAELAKFLTGTWQLLPETNSSLRGGRAYSAVNYRIALEKMLGFLLHLQPEVVFHYYRDEVPRASVDALLPIVEKNLSISRDYMKIKTLTAMLFEAMALETGGDGPLSYFAGESPVPGNPREGLEDFLPKKNFAAPANELEQILHGRIESIQYDLKDAPIASYLYFVCGLERCRDLFAAGQRLAKGELTRPEFFAAFPADFFDAFAEGFAGMCPPRAARVEEILRAVRKLRKT